ncbi:MAG: helix-turn-helix domain-containing protein [Peptococcaceae bacterium]|nr:helix-turn-helix domain-containing protein [Peptococcaceae bacterium]
MLNSSKSAPAPCETSLPSTRAREKPRFRAPPATTTTRQNSIRARTQLRAWIKQYSTDPNLQPAPRSTSSRTSVPGRKTTLEERVEIVCYCLANGKDYDLAINTYHISYQQIYSWVRKYQDLGLEGLLDKRGKRKDPAAMTPVERLQSENKLLQAEIQRLQTENTALKKLHQLERRWG